MKIKFILVIIVFLLSASTTTAQLRVGVKGGMVVNKLHFNKNILASDNQAGFTGGLQLELSLPITGLGLEGSLMYAHRNDKLTSMEQTYHRDFIEIPVHIKYGITLLGLNRLLVPYAFTGPNFSFLFNESEQDLWDNRASNTSWDIGMGIEILRHLQVQASYGIGLTKTFKTLNTDKFTNEIDGRDKYWTVTAAFMF